MKIIQINCVYNNGSTGKIVSDIHKELIKQEYNSVVYFGRGSKTSDKNVYKICGELESHIYHFWANLTGDMNGGCYFATKRLITKIKKENPDIVHLHCINGYFVNIYKLVTWLKINKIKTVLTLHAEFMYTGGCGQALECNQWCSADGCGNIRCPKYKTDLHSWFFDNSSVAWKRMKNAFDGFDNNLIITSVSPWLKERAEFSTIMKGKDHRVVLNGIDTDVFHPYSTENGIELREELGITTKLVGIHVTASFDDEPEGLKGGYYLFELAKLMPDVTFVIAAGKVKEKMELPPNMLLLGRITDQNKLAMLYSMSDFTVITSKRETFSMPVAESQCCGTPVVGFKAGGPEMIAIKKYSSFVEYGNVLELKKSILSIALSLDFRNKIEEHLNVFSVPKMVRDYTKIYKELLTNE